MDRDPRGVMLKVMALLVSFAAVAMKPTTPNAILSGCLIISKDRELIRTHPGLICAYLPSGRFVSLDYNSDKIAFYSKTNMKLWERSGHYHHQLKFSPDRKSLLAMSSSFHTVERKRARYDVLQVLDLEGKTLKEFDFYAHRKQLKALAPDKAKFYPRKEASFPKIVWEFSHANSFYEIQKNDLETAIPAFQSGNYLVNVNLLGLILVLDSKLSKILWSYHYPDNSGDNSHDVQVLANGHLLIYNNDYFDGVKNYSTLDEFDLMNKKLVWRYTASPPEAFHALQGGGIQKLSNGHVLFTDFTKPGVIFEIDQASKVVWAGPDIFKEADGQPRYVQEAKHSDVSEYLNHNSGL